MGADLLGFRHHFDIASPVRGAGHCPPVALSERLTHRASYQPLPMRHLDPLRDQTDSYPAFADLLPDRVIDAGRYRLRFAASPLDLDRILKLRFEVFNLELGEGLDSSFATRRDEDEYDRRCHHLLVEDRRNGDIVGTYRIQTLEMAAAGAGFYSAGEFDLSHFPADLLRDSIETGRACIRRDHRNRQVLFLLWKGLACYLTVTGQRYLFGCCSLTSQDPDEGIALYRQLLEQGQVRDDFDIPVLDELQCHGTGREWTEPVHTPTLFRTYLRYGAKVCSEPALDRDFKTIDYLVLFDARAIDAKTRRLFFT